MSHNDILREEAPHTVAFCDNGSAWKLPADAYETFCIAWVRGDSYWHGEDLWGALVVIQLEDITGVLLTTTQSMQLQKEEREITRLREMFESGGDN